MRVSWPFVVELKLEELVIGFVEEFDEVAEGFDLCAVE